MRHSPLNAALGKEEVIQESYYENNYGYIYY